MRRAAACTFSKIGEKHIDSPQKQNCRPVKNRRPLAVDHLLFFYFDGIITCI